VINSMLFARDCMNNLGSVCKKKKRLTDFKLSFFAFLGLRYVVEINFTNEMTHNTIIAEKMGFCFTNILLKFQYIIKVVLHRTVVMVLVILVPKTVHQKT
jgi:hypothetical protein